VQAPSDHCLWSSLATTTTLACERASASERESACVHVRESVRERVCKRERECVCARERRFVCDSVCERERESVCARERESES